MRYGEWRPLRLAYNRKRKRNNCSRIARMNTDLAARVIRELSHQTAVWQPPLRVKKRTPKRKVQMSSEHMDHMLGSRLVLGGHSFIAELGNDAAIDFDTQLAIVDECLDRGINTFDTTYEPERIALGQLLETLGRRDEAHIIAWNFFTGIRADDYLVAPQPYTASHLDLLLHQLRTDFIDLLVVHPVGDAAADQTQTEIAGAWLACGTVGALGTWNPGSDAAMIFGADNPYEFTVLPRNVENSNTSRFSACRALGWQTFATSPFGRGWLLDRLVQVEEARTSVSPASRGHALPMPCSGSPYTIPMSITWSSASGAQSGLTAM